MIRDEYQFWAGVAKHPRDRALFWLLARGGRAEARGLLEFLNPRRPDRAEPVLMELVYRQLCEMDFQSRAVRLLPAGLVALQPRPETQGELWRPPEPGWLRVALACHAVSCPPTSIAPKVTPGGTVPVLPVAGYSGPLPKAGTIRVPAYASITRFEEGRSKVEDRSGAEVVSEKTVDWRHEQVVIDYLAGLLGTNEMKEHGGLWRVRYREDKDKLRRCCAEFEAQSREVVTRTTGGARLTDLWKEFV